MISELVAIGCKGRVGLLLITHGLACAVCSFVHIIMRFTASERSPFLSSFLSTHCFQCLRRTFLVRCSSRSYSSRCTAPAGPLTKLSASGFEHLSSATYPDSIFLAQHVCAQKEEAAPLSHFISMKVMREACCFFPATRLLI